MINNLLIVLCIFSCAPDPINYEIKLNIIDNVYYDKKNNEPYTGRIFSTYDNGKIKQEGLLKNGIKHGDFIYWHENGKKMRFEMQKTFDIKRRLIKWRDNNIEWGKTGKKVNDPFESKFKSILLQ